MAVKAPNHKCKACGKMYYACNAALTAGNSWKAVCCSPACYQRYQRMVYEARNAQPAEPEKEEVKTVKKRQAKLKAVIAESKPEPDAVVSVVLKKDGEDGSKTDLSI